MRTQAVHLLTGAYALDSLGDADRVEFEDHLPTCADCRAALAGMHEAAVLLAATVALAPPDALRGRVARDITRVRPLPPRGTGGPASRAFVL
jgi:anti-sigma factor RsiW